MELPVALQLRELELALVLGLGLAWSFELLRPLRRGRLSAALADGLWCVLLLLSLLGFALWVGRGRLRLFAAAAMGLSGGLWLGLISPILRRFAGKIPHLVGRREKNGKILEKLGK